MPAPRQSDVAGGPAEQKVRQYLADHADEWVEAGEVRKGTGLRQHVVEELLLILALQDEIERRGNSAEGFVWRLPDPDWMREIRISTGGQRTCWGDRCDACTHVPQYAIDAAMCREHTLAGVCYACGHPMTSSGRAPGDYACEGLQQDDPESLWRHVHGPFAHYGES